MKCLTLCKRRCQLRVPAKPRSLPSSHLLLVPAVLTCPLSWTLTRAATRQTLTGQAPWTRGSAAEGRKERDSWLLNSGWQTSLWHISPSPICRALYEGCFGGSKSIPKHFVDDSAMLSGRLNPAVKLDSLCLKAFPKCRQ